MSWVRSREEWLSSTSILILRYRRRNMHSNAIGVKILRPESKSYTQWTPCHSTVATTLSRLEDLMAMSTFGMASVRSVYVNSISTQLPSHPWPSLMMAVIWPSLPLSCLSVTMWKKFQPTPFTSGVWQIKKQGRNNNDYILDLILYDKMSRFINLIWVAGPFKHHEDLIKCRP